MPQAQFRPCIDLHGGEVKQIVGSTLSDDAGTLKTNFVAAHPPEYYAELYRRDRLAGGHVIMLGPGNRDAALRALSAWPGGLQLGGGINPENAEFFLEAGADKLIVTSYVFVDGELAPDRLEKLVKLVGKDHLVLDLSCRRRGDDYYIVTDRWTKFTSLRVEAESLRFLGSFAAEFLIHAVDVEGKQAGIDGELLVLLSAHSPIDCVYAGGITTLADIRRIQLAGGGRVHYTVGSALDLFGGTLAYDAVKSLRYCD
jgi:phosphoribosylformimino-5-aminoimidazole carboxamide ribotide isomerase